MERSKRSLTRSFGDKDTEEEDHGIRAGDPTDSGPETGEADYSFDGYSVEFIDKVALMPVTLPAPSASQSRRL